jgi:hypothetical protein
LHFLGFVYIFLLPRGLSFCISSLIEGRIFSS